MELGVFVNRVVNDLEQTPLLELGQMVMQVGVAGFVFAHDGGNDRLNLK
jgi:hypothetical protein